MPVITNPAERKARQEQKRRLILRFLRGETWTISEVVGDLLQIANRTAIRATIAQLERAGEVVTESVQVGALKYKIIGITPHGQALAWRPDSGEPLISRYYERGRVGISTFAHTIELQKLRIKLARAGWKDWTNMDRNTPAERSSSQVKRQNYKRPDALARHPLSGQVWAVDCERSVKTRKRYQHIVESHLTSIRQGKFAAVVWVCPEPKIARALDRVIRSIAYARVLGEDRMLTDDDHRRLIVVDYETVVNL